MRTVKEFAAALLALGSLTSTLGNAEVVVTVDPDNYEFGTVMTNLAPGLTVSLLEQAYGQYTYNPTRNDVVTIACPPGNYHCPLSAGAAAFGTTGLAEGYDDCLAGRTDVFSDCRSGFRVMEFALGSPADFVEVSVGYGPDGPALFAYDTAGNELARCIIFFEGDFGTGPCEFEYELSYPPSASNVVMTLRRISKDISRIVVGGYLGSSTINQFAYAESDPGRLLEHLRKEVAGASSLKGLERKVILAQTYFAAGDIQATCAVLSDFVSTVSRMSSGKKPKLSPETAAQLTTDAEEIMASIGCY